MSSSERSRARCSVVLCVEVLPDDEWGDDCTVAQVRQQGVRSAEAVVRRMLETKVHGGRVKLVRIDAVNVVTFSRPPAEPAGG